jgi:hypothetical protein
VPFRATALVFFLGGSLPAVSVAFRLAPLPFGRPRLRVIAEGAVTSVATGSSIPHCNATAGVGRGWGVGTLEMGDWGDMGGGSNVGLDGADGGV